MARLPSLAARLEALPRAWIGTVLTAALAASSLRPPVVQYCEQIWETQRDQGRLDP